MTDESLTHLLLRELMIFGWRDAVEISALAYLFYKTSLWLKKDRQKNLIPSFYAYCSLHLFAYYTHLPTLSFVLLLTTPAVAMLFILVHQETLQRNFVSLKNTLPATPISTDWLEGLVRASLLAVTNNKTFLCVIEHNDTLSDFINCALPVNTQLNATLLEALVDSSSFDQKKMVWLNRQGKLLGLNATWKHNAEDWSNTTAKTLPSWKQDALLLTAKTDALVLHIAPEVRLFELVIQGKVIEQISTHHIITLIKNSLGKQIAPTKGESTHAQQHKNRPTA